MSNENLLGTLRKSLESVIDTINEQEDRYNKIYFGQLMTLIDATFNDPIQRKAFKDSVKNISTGIMELQPHPESEIRFFMGELEKIGLDKLVPIEAFPPDIPIVVRYSEKRIAEKKAKNKK